MADMPTGYLVEKGAAVGRQADWLNDMGGFIDAFHGEVSHLRFLAQSIVEEIDKWRGQ